MSEVKVWDGEHGCLLKRWQVGRVVPVQCVWVGQVVPVQCLSSVSLKDSLSREAGSESECLSLRKSLSLRECSG